MTRISILDQGDMNDRQRRLYDALTAAGKPVGGPYWAYIRNPKLMGLVQDTSNCLQESGVTTRERQIAILAVARHWGAEYPWAVQAKNSLAAGVEPEIIDAINAGTKPELTDPREISAYEVAVELLADKGLSDASYERAEAAFGPETLVSLVATVGQFSMTCCTANAFDITPPDDVPHRLAG